MKMKRFSTGLTPAICIRSAFAQDTTSGFVGYYPLNGPMKPTFLSRLMEVASFIAAAKWRRPSPRPCVGRLLSNRKKDL
jgi:hypothetical protein